jgi:hypothetical protein
LDLETRRKKQQDLMVKMVERKVRSRAKELYESRGQEAGQELQDWFQAESEVLENSTIAPLYRRVKAGAGESATSHSGEQLSSADPTCA